MRRFHQANKKRSVIYILNKCFFPFQCTSDNNAGADISHRNNNNDADNSHDDDILITADLMTFAWQIAKGMVRAVLRAHCRDWTTCYRFVLLRVMY